MQNIQNFINGNFSNPLDEQYVDNINPSTGEVYGLIPRSNQKDVDEAIIAAEHAFFNWSNSSQDYRSKVMMKISELIEENLNDLALAESIDNGKPLSLATTVDIPRAASNFRFFAQAITQFSSESHESQGRDSINFTLRKPIGVVGCISPWNLPLYLFTWKIAPALAAGNCVIAKHSEVTPMTAYLLSQICKEAGLPDGVLNIVHGYGHEVGQAIVEHPKVKAISFTGGTTTGQAIARTAAPLFKKLSLELGGKNPNLIFADCNYEKMLSTTLRSSFANQGQICLCGSRIYVESSIYEKFKTDFVEKVKALKVGHPVEDDVNLGALVSKPHLEKVQSFVQFAKDSPDAEILYGGEKVHLKDYPKGFYMRPCVIELKDNLCQLNQVEIFGPVVSIMAFETEAEAVRLANESKYGLSCTIWTQNLNRSMRLSNQIESGIIWINTWLNRDLRTPFGGMKQSGIGREGGLEALRFFTEPKNVCIDYSK
jgi:aminomuconate-semialdehyde/2-hydroxymuconate-6-semialdehyde dehydrogenase